jgi:hypothetical protein
MHEVTPIANAFLEVLYATIESLTSSNPYIKHTGRRVVTGNNRPKTGAGTPKFTGNKLIRGLIPFMNVVRFGLWLIALPAMLVVLHSGVADAQRVVANGVTVFFEFTSVL